MDDLRFEYIFDEDRHGCGNGRTRVYEGELHVANLWHKNREITILSHDNLHCTLSPEDMQELLTKLAEHDG